MTAIIKVSRDGFNKIIPLLGDIIHAYKIVNICYRYEIWIMSSKEKINKEYLITKNTTDRNLLLTFDYDKTLLLLVNFPDTVLTLSLGKYSVGYNTIHEKIFANFQNLQYISCEGQDIFSVDNNKLLVKLVKESYLINNYFDFETTACKELSMKSLLAKTNLELIEYATIFAMNVSGNNYYYNLRWIDKLMNLKELNLKFYDGVSQEYIDNIFKNINFSINLQKLRIKLPIFINTKKIKVPFNTKLEFIYTYV